jgi:hypothetical protein
LDPTSEMRRAENCHREAVPQGNGGTRNITARAAISF